MMSIFSWCCTSEEETNETRFLDRFKLKLRSGVSVTKLDSKGSIKVVLRLVNNDQEIVFLKVAASEHDADTDGPILGPYRLNTVLGRRGTDPDPLAPDYAGTAVLRKQCAPCDAKRAFVLMAGTNVDEADLAKTHTLSLLAKSQKDALSMVTGFNLLYKESNSSRRPKRGFSFT